MNDKEKKLVLGLYRKDEEAKRYLFNEYTEFVRKDIEYHERLGLLSLKWLSPDGILYEFAHLADSVDLSDSRHNIRQILHLLVANRAYTQFSLHPGVASYLIKDYDPRYERAVSPFMGLWLLSSARGGEVEFRENEEVEQFRVDTEQSLTPEYLEEHLVPYLQSLADTQHAMDDLRGHARSRIVIRGITQRSPVTISFQGIADAMNAVLDIVVPWRRKNAQTLAALKTLELAVEIEKKKEEMRATAKKALVEANKTEAETSKILQDVEEQRIKNMKLEADVEAGIFNLALQAIQKMKPELPVDEQVYEAIRMLPPMKRLATSEIEIKRLNE